MKKLIGLIALCSVFSLSYSQNSFSSGYYIDGVFLSDMQGFSSARSTALAGAYSSLGGDLGAIGQNPAGIGVFRTSQFSFTPAFSSVNTNSTFSGQENTDFIYKMNLHNIGVNMNINTDNGSGWQCINLVLGYNQLANYSGSYKISGLTTGTSMANEFINFANGSKVNDLNSYFEQLAYRLIVIDADSGSTSYHSAYDNIPLKQQHTLEKNGSVGTYYFGMGTNYDHKLYLGFNFNIISGNYQYKTNHTEIDINDLITDNSFSFGYNLDTWVKGWNLGIGVIYRPIETLRLGLSIQTPSFIKITQETSTRMTATPDNGKTFVEVPTDEYGYELGAMSESYDITTPAKYTAGISYLFEDKGLISFDYEIEDFTKIKFSNSDYGADYFSTENSEMKDNMRIAQTFRLGAEAKLNKFYLRGGCAYKQSPYSSGMLNSDAYTMLYAAGFGYNTGNTYIDFTYSLQTVSENYLMYNHSALPKAELETSSGKFLLTVGFKF
ncbi:MAG TPA: hypothetical protein PK252_06505 [Bacteroidales bacterium]|nr:hypothetical protein [Bacteroidales bacterium]